MHYTCFYVLQSDSVDWREKASMPTDITLKFAAYTVIAEFI